MAWDGYFYGSKTRHLNFVINLFIDGVIWLLLLDKTRHLNLVINLFIDCVRWLLTKEQIKWFYVRKCAQSSKCIYFKRILNNFRPLSSFSNFLLDYHKHESKACKGVLRIEIECPSSKHILFKAISKFSNKSIHRWREMVAN